MQIKLGETFQYFTENGQFEVFEEFEVKHTQRAESNPAAPGASSTC